MYMKSKEMYVESCLHHDLMDTMECFPSKRKRWMTAEVSFIRGYMQCYGYVKSENNQDKERMLEDLLKR